MEGVVRVLVSLISDFDIVTERRGEKRGRDRIGFSWGKRDRKRAEWREMKLGRRRSADDNQYTRAD